MHKVYVHRKIVCICILHKEKLLVVFKEKNTHRGLCLVWRGRKKKRKKKERKRKKKWKEKVKTEIKKKE